MHNDSLEQQQVRRLRRSRRFAVGLLALAGGVFAATLLAPVQGTAILFARAVAEAALVGGLADWFAVVALFRRPLGLPIPHTAILPANKERIGEGLARFLDRNFLTPDVLLPELRALGVAERVALWLARPRNATVLAVEIAKALPYLLRAIDDREIAAFLGRALGDRVGAAQLAPLAAALMRAVTAAGYHESALDAALDYAGDFLARHEEELLQAVGGRRRRWMPRAINREIARAVLRGAAELLDDLRRPEGAARQSLIAAIDEFAARLAAPPAPGSSAGGPSASGAAILDRPEMRAWIAASWQSGRDLVLRDLAAPSSRLRQALTLALAGIGEALQRDEAMRRRLDTAIEALVAEALPWRAELIRVVTEIVRRWEPRGFAERIELAVGPDLQYIRINGTLVGGLVGGVLYALSLLAR